jgi:hypothetical protein
MGDEEGGVAPPKPRRREAMQAEGGAQGRTGEAREAPARGHGGAG